MAGDAGVWTESFRVRSYEADATGAATPASLCNFLQEAASNHAYALGFSLGHLRDRGLTWMLSRLRIESSQTARWGDTVTVETWPSGTHGVFALRDFIVRDDAGSVLARAATGWLLIDLERRRPARLPEDILGMVSPDREHALAFIGDRVPAPVDVMTESPLTVRWTDMDVNEHVNNVRYLAWALDSLPEEVLRASELEALSVDFLGESRLGDRLFVRTQRVVGLGLRFVSEIASEPDASPVARVAGSWRVLSQNDPR